MPLHPLIAEVSCTVYYVYTFYDQPEDLQHPFNDDKHWYSFCGLCCDFC